jgi:ABC-type uncharacterized transport system involved in gliding motility auxiliary subunit
MDAATKKMKKWSARRFAPIGLWISGIGIAGGFILLVLKLLAFINIYTITNAKLINLLLWISLGALAFGLALYALLDPKKVRDFLGGRQARHGSNAAIMLAASLLILIVINAIVYQNPIQWDWTENKQNSLAPETISALKMLPAPVHAIGFFTSRISKTSAETLLNNVKSKSNGKFSYEFIDPEAYPAKAEQYKVTQDGTIVLSMSDRQELFTSSTEQDFTNSLVKLMNPGERTVYFLTGHGEHNTETSGEKSYTRAKTVLESKNYTVKSLNLLAQNKVPDDALAVVIAGPTQPITTEELSLLKDYVSKGGSLVVLEDPVLTTSDTKPSDPLLDYLASTWDIKLNNDLVIDPSSNQVVVAVENTYGTHAITNSLTSQNLVSFFPTARSLTLDSTNPDVTTTALVKTVDSAWGETDFAALQNNQVSFDSKTDFPGPLTVVAASESSNGKGRVVVAGDSDFASDAYFDQYGNSDMFINSVDWAAGQENMISLTAKQTTTRTMKPLSSLTVVVLAFAFVILIPGLIVAGGISSWLVRRSRG